MLTLAVAVQLLQLLWDTLICLLAIPLGRLLPSLHVSPKNLSEKTAIITGANSGIGYQLALELTRQGATVFLACRNPGRGEKARQKIIDSIRSSEHSLESHERLLSRVMVVELDISLLSSARAFAQTWQKDHRSHQINILIHNAGITSTHNQPTTEEGLGRIYATNFLGSFVLTALLEDSLAPDARVILTSSTAQAFSTVDSILGKLRGLPPPGTKIRDSVYYADTKLAQVAFARMLQRRWDEGHGKTAVSENAKDDSRKTKRRIVQAFSPGYTFTPIFDTIPTQPFWTDPLFWLLKFLTFLSIPVDQGAATGLWLATTEDADLGLGGGYWDRMVRRMTVVDITSDDMLERLWRGWERDGDVVWK